MPIIAGEDSVTLHFWHITESVDELQQMYKECHAHFLKNHPIPVWIENKHKLAARLLIYHTFHSHSLEFDGEGKPFLQHLNKAESANFHINYSHASNWVVLAHHPQTAVGVDIEAAREKLTRVYTRFCSEKEQSWLGDNPSVSTLQKCWCAKEAVYKAIGKKGSDFRNHFYIQPFEENDTIIRMEVYRPEIHESVVVFTIHLLPWNNQLIAYCLLAK